MKTRLLTIAMLAMLLFGTFGIIKPAFANGMEVYIVPDPASFTSPPAAVNDLFTVSVWIKNTPSPATVSGVQIAMQYDDSLINVTQWTLPNANPSFFMPEPPPVTTLPAPPDPAYTHVGPNLGQIGPIAISKGGLPPVAPWGHDGIIMTIEFKIKQVPGKLQTLSSLLDISLVDTFVLDETGATMAVTLTDGHYSISWTAPPAPYMGLTPLHTVFGPNPPTAIGQTYFQGIYIKGYNSQWGLTAAAFTLHWNASVVEIVNPLADIIVDPAFVAAPPIVYIPGSGMLAVSLNVVVPPPTGNVLAVTVMFTVMTQAVNPPTPSSYKDFTTLTFSDVFFMDHIGPIPVGISEVGDVTVWTMSLKPPQPWLEVVPPSTTLGPSYVVGSTFTVDVKITGPLPDYLGEAWHLVGIQYMLTYDPTIIQLMGVAEGPFMQNPTWNLYGTVFLPIPEPTDVIIAELLVPNASGLYDQTTFPNGQGVIAHFTFLVMKQGDTPSHPPNVILTSPLDLEGIFGQWGLDKDGEYISFNETATVDGLVTILPFPSFFTGRRVDLIGGANNAGYGPGYPGPFPDPYGGQGPNMPMDLVIPQSEISLYAFVTYNNWPVQSKDVGFEIEGPFYKVQEGIYSPLPAYQIWGKFTARSDTMGVAKLTYRMPWPCVDPESVMGIYRITATVNIADQVVMDTMVFYYEYLVNVYKVTTDKAAYNHEESVLVTVFWSTHVLQSAYPALFATVIQDELGVPFGMALHTLDPLPVAPVFCTAHLDEFTVEIYIPKFAYAGWATIHVSVYDKDPTIGGFAWAPEFAPVPTILILPA